MKCIKTFFLALLPLGALFLNSCDPAEEYIVTDNISGDRVWTADTIYIIDGSLTLNEGAVLTIEPGTTIRFNAGASLVVGYNNNTTFIADGDKKHPITFTSNATRPVAGAWTGIFFYDKTLSNSLMDNCIIEYAGVENYGAIRLLGSTITMDSCEINECAGSAISATGSFTEGGFKAFTNNTIRNYAQYAIEISANKVSVIDTTNRFDGEGGILLLNKYSSSTPQTWKNLDVPYIVEGSLNIEGTLTVEPGTIFKFAANGEMVFGYSENTTFIADGKSTDTPIIFTSTAPSPVAGAWVGLTFYQGALSNCKLNYCTVEYAGSDQGAIDVVGNTAFTITNCLINESASYGISFNGSEAGALAFTGNTVQNCSDHLIKINAKHVPELGTGNTLTPAAYKGILVQQNANYETPVTWIKQTADYYINGNCSLNGDVTFQPGTVFRFDADGGFTFGYSTGTRLSAEGTSDAPIRFTSSAAMPAAGAWANITFYDNTAVNSIMNWCILEYCGDNNAAGITSWASMTVSNSQVNDCAALPAKRHSTAIISGEGNNFTWSVM